MGVTSRRRREVVGIAVAVFAVSAPGAGAREAIVGGTPAVPGAWPSNVALVDPAAADPSAGQFCSGTLIESSWVVTAQHCLHDQEGNPIAPAAIDVIAGVTDLADSAAGQRRTVASIRFHPSADVGLLQLASPIAAQTNPPITPMDIVTVLDDDLWTAGQPAHVAGWGSTTALPEFVLTDQLREAGVTILSDATCQEVPSWGPFFLPSEELCADNPGSGSDPCVGDSGGPLTVTNASGTRLLAGIVSYGSPNACGDTPTVYTRIAEPRIRDWIYQANLGRTPPAPVSNATAVTEGRPHSALLSWQRPTSEGSDPLLGYVITVRKDTGAPLSTITVPTTATDLRVGGLNDFNAGVGDRYSLTVSPVSRAGNAAPQGQSIRPLGVGAQFTLQPAFIGQPRVGLQLLLSLGAWTFPDGPVRTNLGLDVPSIEACNVPHGPCKRVATASPYTVTSDVVGKRLRFTVSVAPPGFVPAFATSGLSKVVPPSVRGSLLSKPQPGVIRIRASVATQVGSEIVVQLLNKQGRRIRLSTAGSRIDGRRFTASGSGKLRGTVRNRTSILTVVTAGRRNGPARTHTLLVSVRKNGSVDTNYGISVKVPS